MDDDEFYLFSKRRGQLIKEGWEEKPGTFTDEFGDVKELTARRISGITEISAQPNPIGDYENLMLKEHISKLVSAASAKAKHEQFAPMELISKQAKIKYDAKQKYIKEGGGGDSGKLWPD
jgi:hypothetical protein